jgi:hypothetical protein
MTPLAVMPAAQPHRPLGAPLETRPPQGTIDAGHTGDRSSAGEHKEEDRAYGLYLGTKSETLFRVAALNVGRFPIDPQGPKMADCFQHVKRLRPDVMGFSEFGLNPLAMERHQQWSARTRGQFKTLKSRVAFNEHAKGTEQTLWEGTGIMCLDRMAVRVFKQGKILQN